MNCTLTRGLPGGVESRLEPHFGKVVVFDHNRPATPEELRGLVRDAEVLVVTVADRVDESVLAAAARLRLLVTFSVGLDHIDTAGVKRRKVPLVHTPDVLTDATADLAFTLMLAGARRLKPALRYVEEGKWTGFDPSLYLGLELSGSELFIVGLGKIGSAVARRAAAFGMRILYSGPEHQVPGVTTVQRVALEQGLRRADVATLHCPLNAQTKGIIGRKELGLMKPGAVLVNTARGPLVDEAALVAHLRAHPDFFAGLDVYSEEPKLPAGLVALPNALCVPHIGSATRRARDAMAKVCVDEAIRFANGEPLEYGWSG